MALCGESGDNPSQRMKKRPSHPPPPPSPSPGAHHGSAADRLVRARVEALLAPWVADSHDRAFVLRCLVDEGPSHHRGATVALLLLLERTLQRCPPLPEPGPGADPQAPPAAAISLRLPPHLRAALDPAERDYPLSLPTAALGRAIGDPRTTDLLIEHLTDGPPHHALANALMVTLLEAILARLGDGPEGPGA